MTSPSERRRILPHALIFLLSVSRLFAADLTWTGAGAVFFDDQNNWNPQQSPSASDNLFFFAGPTNRDLNISGSQSVGDISFLGGNYTMLGGTGSSLTHDDFWVNASTVTASGDNTSWTFDDMRVGDTGGGVLNVDSGADLNHRGVFLGSTANGSGVLNLTGNGTTIDTATGSARIGQFGSGTLNVLSGARFDATSIYLGELSTADGLATVNGNGSALVANAASLVAGYEGTGNLNIAAGGRAEATNGGNVIAGELEDSVGTIAMNAGRLDVGERLYVGNHGQGTFTANNSSTIVSDLQMILGRRSTGSGTATLDNSSLTITNSIHDLIVGWAGTGQMSIQNGATATIADDVIIGHDAGSTANQLEIKSGATVTADDFRTGFHGGGILLVNSGATISGQRLDVAEIVDSSGTATIDGAGTTASFSFMTIANEGTGTATISGGAHVDVNHTDTANIFVGDSGSGIGTLTVTGPGTQLTSNKRIEVGGSNNDNGGQGTMHIQNRATVDTVGAVIGHSQNSSGTLGNGIVNAERIRNDWDTTGNPLWLAHHGAGQLNIKTGAAVTASSLRMANPNNGALAKLTLEGSGSSLTVSGAATLGEGRAATTQIKTGATLITGNDGVSNASIGDLASADGAKVEVLGGTWNHNGGRIRVGNSGGSSTARSELKVSLGGTVTSADRIMIADSASTGYGYVEVKNADSTVTAENMVVGDGGHGELQISDGGVVTINAEMDVAGTSTGRGAVVVKDVSSQLNVTSDVAIGRDNGSTGSMYVSLNGAVTTGDLNIAQLSGSTGNVYVQSNGRLQVNSGSMLTVGGSAGSVGGNGTLYVEGGTVEVKQDTVAVTANGRLDLTSGKLELANLTRSAGRSIQFHSWRTGFQWRQSARRGRHDRHL